MVSYVIIGKVKNKFIRIREKSIGWALVPAQSNALWSTAHCFTCMLSLVALFRLKKSFRVLLQEILIIYTIWIIISILDQNNWMSKSWLSTDSSLIIVWKLLNLSGTAGKLHFT